MEIRQPGSAAMAGDYGIPVIQPRAHLCQTYNLPAGGVIIIPGSDPVTLSGPAAYRPACTAATQPAIITGNGGTIGTDLAEVVGGAGVTIDEPENPGPQFSDFRDPFYASTFPQCYALAATTVIAYTLVIMLFITPRSFLDGGVVVLGGRGFTNSGTGGTNIGGRPWLQKVAALTVAISLTIATADTFKVAEEQYSWGIQNAPLLQQEVLGGTELKVIRIISDTFLWLAQAQTLIRLFPRQREKVIIKWTAFSLITLDLIFDSLNSFYYASPGRTFTDAVPALSYLFQLSLGVLYAAWVIYYSLMKKRYAFYHPQMRNMCLVAFLSLLALLVPVVFFVLDISKPELTGWGDYVRWVGAAAASVIVWEWVERIEALEREEKKDGILGREVFDGDEMMEITPPEFSWPRKRKTRRRKDDKGDGGESGGIEEEKTSAAASKSNWPSMASITSRYRTRSKNKTESQSNSSTAVSQPRTTARFLQPPLWPARPPVAVTPVSRTDTASADSTVYAVRYHPLTETTSRTTEQATPQPPLSRSNSPASSHRGQREPAEPTSPADPPQGASSAKRWRALAQAMPFRRDKEPSSSSEQARTGHRLQHDEAGKWDLRSRLEEFAVSQADKIREKIKPTVDTGNLPTMVIPAPARRGAALAQVLEEEENANHLSTRQMQRSDTEASGTSPTAVASAPPLRRSDSDSSTSSAGQAVVPPASHQGPSLTVEAVSRLASNQEGTRLSQAALDKRPAQGPLGDDPDRR